MKRDPNRRVHKTHSVTLTDEAWGLLQQLAEDNGATCSGIIERLVRESSMQRKAAFRAGER